VLVSLRGDQELNEVKLANALSARLAGDHGALLGVEPLTAELLRQERLELDLSALPLGYLGPDLEDAVLAQHGLVVDHSKARAGTSGLAAQNDKTPRLERSFLRLFDPTAAALEAFVCGANQADLHRVGVNWEGLGLTPAANQVVDLRAAQPGDRCLHDASARLEAARGIEVGHIFQLGRKYSQAMEATFTNEQGVDEPLWMGCYGIGVSRLAQAAVEQHHDENGIIWPAAIAPFTAIVVIANVQEAAQVALAEQLYGELQAAGHEVLLDDRPERAGVKFKDADLIGIPWRVVVGRGAAAGQVELVRRADGDRQELAVGELVAALERQIR